MFVLVSQGISGDLRFQLRNRVPRFVYQCGGSNTRDREQRFDAIAGLLDLLEFTFQSKLVGLGCCQFAIQVLQIVLHKAASRSAGAGASSRL